MLGLGLAGNSSSSSGEGASRHRSRHRKLLLLRLDELEWAGATLKIPQPLGHQGKHPGQVEDVGMGG